MEGWTPKSRWNYAVLRELLGPATDIKSGPHGYARWDYHSGTPANPIFGSTNILSSAMVVNSPDRKFSVYFTIEVPNTGIDGGAVDKIYPGLSFTNSTETLTVVNMCIFTAMMAICRAVLYLTGRQDIRQARDSFIEDNAVVKGGNDIDKIKQLRGVYLEAVAALSIDTMESFVNVPSARNADTNLPMQSEMVKLSEILTESRQKKEKFNTSEHNISSRRYNTDNIVNRIR